MKKALWVLAVVAMIVGAIWVALWALVRIGMGS
jgi:hypothetical protein